MADRVGQHFGNYRLVALLGQGGFAEVYLGQHVRFDQQAAIKVLHAHLSEQEAEHFQREAQRMLVAGLRNFDRSCLCMQNLWLHAEVVADC